MVDIQCGYTDRDEALVAYLYGEIDQAERTAFDAHLSTCDRCRRELTELRELRGQLQTWSEPSMPEEPDALPPPPRTAPRLVHTGIAPGATDPAPHRQRWNRWRDLSWARAAAALLVLGVSGGLANLDVRYDASGFSIRTGWLPRPSGTSPVRGAAPNASSALAADATSSSPWRTDLQALEERLKTEIHASPAPRPGWGPADEGDMLRQVRVLLRESERQQQNDLALRIAEVMKEFDAKRNADLMNINQSMRTMQSNTGIEVLKQREALSRLDYLVRASGQR